MLSFLLDLTCPSLGCWYPTRHISQFCLAKCVHCTPAHTDILSSELGIYLDSVVLYISTVILNETLSSVHIPYAHGEFTVFTDKLTYYDIHLKEFLLKEMKT